MVYFYRLAISNDEGSHRRKSRRTQAVPSRDNSACEPHYRARERVAYLQRLFHAKRDVTENKDKIDPNTYQVLSAFARGVNEYISEHRSQIPGWIDSITPEDIEALERSDYLRFYSAHDALQKIQRKAYKFPQFGSNHWAISPFRSANGRVIHVESTHMPWDNRFQNYEAHLIVPGKLDIGGISWFGSPFFLDGFKLWRAAKVGGRVKAVGNFVFGGGRLTPFSWRRPTTRT